MMHAGVKKQALDMQRRFEIDQIGPYTAIKKVRKGCSVCQACNPDNRNVKGEAQWTPVPAHGERGHGRLLHARSSHRQGDL